MIKKSQIKQTNNNNTVKYIQNNTVKLVLVIESNDKPVKISNIPNAALK